MPGVFGQANIQSGNSLVDNTVLGVVNTVANTANSAANIAVSGLAVVAGALEPYTNELNALATMPEVGPAVAMGVKGVSELAALGKAGQAAEAIAPLIKAGSAGGETAGRRFPEAVKAAAKAENPTATCVFCRMEGTGTQVDHAIPRASGGNATLDNAQLACPHCNASKGAGNFPKTPPAGYGGPWPPSDPK